MPAMRRMESVVEHVHLFVVIVANLRSGVKRSTNKGLSFLAILATMGFARGPPGLRTMKSTAIADIEVAT